MFWYFVAWGAFFHVLAVAWYGKRILEVLKPEVKKWIKILRGGKSE